MTIETTHAIGDLIQWKYQRAKTMKLPVAFMIYQIETATCNAGTQVFFICRPVHFTYELHFNKDNPKERIIEDVAFGGYGDKEFVKLRSDEVQPCDPSIVEEIRKHDLDAF